MATLVQNPPSFNQPSEQYRQPGPNVGFNSQYPHPHPHQHHPRFHHHRPHHHANHHHYHNRQHHAPSYTAAVPMLYPQAAGGAPVASTNFFKQINIIPGLDAENAIVDTGVKIYRPNVGQVQVQNSATNEYDGKRMRRSIQRRTVDYNASTIQMLKNRLYKRSILQKPVVQCDPLYYTDITQPRALLHNPVNSVTTRFVRASTNKIRCPVFTVAWTPEGRRVLTGTSSGEFTLWNGLTFNFETILQAHESAVRAMEWSHNDMWLLSGDHGGFIKYWQSNMNNVKMIQAHTDPIRGLSFCPTDNKFVTCSDDGLIKVWDFYRCQEELTLRGHGADVKCVGWHPSKCMVASGSKDSQQPLKLWDPRTATNLGTIHSHKSTVMDLQWNKNGNWLLSGSRDRLVKVFDIRVMKEIHTFRGHKKEAASINWHPLYENMFASGGSDGSIMFWLMGCEKELGCIENAHDGMIWDLKWHPLGHILCSGSNDHTTKFWTRNRPGDKMRDKYNLNVLPTGFEDDYEYEIPNSSQSEAETSIDESVPNAVLSTPIKGEMDMFDGKPDLDSPIVKVLLEQSTLEVTKSKNAEIPAQIYTVTRKSIAVPTFKIDPSKQKEAIEEVERLEKRREKLLREGIERTKRRKVNQDEVAATADVAPSLLQMDVEMPEFLVGLSWEDGDEPTMAEAKMKSAKRNMRFGPVVPAGDIDDGLDPNAGPIGPSGPIFGFTNHGPQSDGHFDQNMPPFESGGGTNFQPPKHFEGQRFDSSRHENFHGHPMNFYDEDVSNHAFDNSEFEGPRPGPMRDWDGHRPHPRPPRFYSDHRPMRPRPPGNFEHRGPPPRIGGPRMSHPNFRGPRPVGPEFHEGSFNNHWHDEM